MVIRHLLITAFSLTLVSCPAPPCLVSDTPILTPNGVKPIQNLMVGDTVISYDKSTKSIITNRITAIKQGETKQTITLILDNQSTIEGTGEHPFYLLYKKTYVEMKDLSVGNVLLSSDGEEITIKAIQGNQYKSKVKIYTISLQEPFPNYFANRILVHNKSFVFNSDFKNLPNIDWADRDLRGISLSYANLSNANLSNANLSGVSLDYAELSDANFFGANLSDSYMQNVNLSRANLFGANLTNAYLPRANLINVKLNIEQYLYLRSRGIDGFKPNLSNVNLSMANLSNANLSGANLSGANLSNANLSDANLNSANLSNANLSYVNLSNASLSNTATNGVITYGAVGITSNTFLDARP